MISCIVVPGFELRAALRTRPRLLLAPAGLAPELQEEQTCCFAKQNKAIVYDPDGTMLEWYRLIEDSNSFFAETSCPDTDANAHETGTCCAQTGSCCAA